MENQEERAQWEARLGQWGERLAAWGLNGLAVALLEVAEPLSLLGAQVLYVAQPALGLFVPGKEVGRWAQLLEDPANVARARVILAGAPETDASPGGEGDPDGFAH